MTPIRIQRKRTKGWRMPAGAVYVGRGTIWGNPYKVGISLGKNDDGTYRYMTRQDAVDRFCDGYLHYWIHQAEKPLPIENLRGKDLACWCPVMDKDGNRVPCHADILLEIANS